MSEDANRANPNPPPVDRLSQLWRRVYDHKIAQWSVAYIAVAYALLQGLVLMGGAFDWPDAVLRASMLLLILGLPVVITLAWYHGERASRNFSAAELTIISLLLVIGAVVFYAFVQPQEDIAADQAPPAQQTGVEKARAAANSPVTGISLAVLPLANVSADSEQEFFSDGITDEISGALAKIPDLRVVGRTSAFQYKNRANDLRAIGEELSATHLIAGSVRKVGERVRITVQLIRSENGLQLWSETYDRELTDIFAIQEDIARAIATSLRIPLGLNPGENLVTNRDIDPASHERFLRAKAIYDAREGPLLDYATAESLLNEVIAKTPGYAPAWALMGAIHFERANDRVRSNGPVAEIRTQINEFRTKGEAAAQRAIQADPNLPLGYAILAVFSWSRSKLLEAEQLYERALALDPADAYVLDQYATRLTVAGRLTDALTQIEKAHAIEPFLPGTSRRTAMVLWLDGKNDDAIALAKTLRASDRAPPLATIYASMGRFAEAADALIEIAADPNSAPARAASLLRAAPARSASPDTLPYLPTELESAYLHVGAADHVLVNYERMAEAGYFQGIQAGYVWHPTYSPVRKTERFKTLVRKVGLVAYWRVKGWPQFCRPTIGDDFECS
jgi:adenylate cyclase